MAISILVRLRDGRYDAGGLDPSGAEWPPNPARLFCALVAGALDGGDWQALRWLETAAPPQVWATRDVVLSRTNGYVVTNKTESEPKSLSWPGRTAKLSGRSSVLPGDDTYAIVWPAAEPDDVTLARLSRLASRVGFVGRSTSTAQVTVVAECAEPRLTWVCHLPVPIGTNGSTTVRVPRPGYADALAAAHDEGARAWQVPALVLPYAAPAPPVEPQTAVVDGPYRDLLVWGVTRPSMAIGGDDVLTVTRAMRRAVLSRVIDPIPSQVSGHGADGRPHVAFLGLVDVQHKYARGHLLGVGVAVPRDMPDADRRSLLRGLLGAGAAAPLSELRDGRGWSLSLQYAPSTGAGLQPERWQAARGCRRWVTATPLMLDRYPRNPRGPEEVAEVVETALVTAGYPPPDRVELRDTPVVAGGVRTLRAGTLRDLPRRPFVHCRVHFRERVRGPVLAGALRYFGGGLFVPEASNADA